MKLERMNPKALSIQNVDKMRAHFYNFVIHALFLTDSIPELSKCANCHARRCDPRGLARTGAEGVAAVRGLLQWRGQAGHHRTRSGLLGGLCGA